MTSERLPYVCKPKLLDEWHFLDNLGHEANSNQLIRRDCLKVEG